jgi:hypothetical protein
MGYRRKLRKECPVTSTLVKTICHPLFCLAATIRALAAAAIACVVQTRRSWRLETARIYPADQRSDRSRNRRVSEGIRTLASLIAALTGSVALAGSPAVAWQEVVPGAWRAQIGRRDCTTLTEAAEATPRSDRLASMRKAPAFEPLMSQRPQPRQNGQRQARLPAALRPSGTGEAEGSSLGYYGSK